MSHPLRLALAALWMTACGGAVAPSVDSADAGPSSGGPGSSAGTGGGSGTSGGSSSGGPTTGGPSAGMGSFGGSSGPAMSASAMAGSPSVAGADGGARPTMPAPVSDAAAPTRSRDAAVVRCNNPGPAGGAGGGGAGGPGSCSGFAEETCNGVSYSVTCACPQGTCACLGPSSAIVAFAGCPSCPSAPEELLAACGFPQ